MFPLYIGFQCIKCVEFSLAPIAIEQLFDYRLETYICYQVRQLCMFVIMDNPHVSVNTICCQNQSITSLNHVISASLFGYVIVFVYTPSETIRHIQCGKFVLCNRDIGCSILMLYIYLRLNLESQLHSFQTFQSGIR